MGLFSYGRNKTIAFIIKAAGVSVDFSVGVFDEIIYNFQNATNATAANAAEIPGINSTLLQKKVVAATTTSVLAGSKMLATKTVDLIAKATPNLIVF